MSDISAQRVLDFWFSELTPADWFRKSDAVDALIAQRFAGLHTQASAGELWVWRATPSGQLAEIIILDQFSRNLFRQDARAFSQDVLALVLAQQAVALGADRDLSVEQRRFVYMPYMHSESLRIHEQAVLLFSQKGLEGNLDFEHRHKTIIERFGRYPHRNAILGRTSTEEELAFLQTPGSSF